MTMTHTPNSEQTPSQKVVDYLNKKGKLELWAGTIAAKGLAFGQRQQELNQTAEDANTRRKLWGEESGQKSGDEMSGHTILGDIIVPQSQQQQPQQSSGLGKVLAGAAIGAALLGIPAAGAVGYLASQYLQNPSVVPPTDSIETETIDLGLLRLEDLEE